MPPTMWKTVKDYFLERFSQKNKAEREKAFYLLLSTLTVSVFFTVLFLAHLIFRPGQIFVYGDMMGVAGCLLALYQFRKGKIETAGKYLIGFTIAFFTVNSVLADVFRHDPAIRYHLYVTLTSILGTFFLFISFFRNIRQLVYFTVLFIGILTVHFLIILHQIGSDPAMAYLAFEHYVVAVMCIVADTVISGLLITLIEKLYSQALEQGEVILRQNEELQETVDEQTRFLVSSNESHKEFAYLTSHDLREPLRSISGFVSLIRKHCDNMENYAHKKEVAEYFDYVQRGVRQMEDLITDIREYSEINVLEKNFAPVPMGDLIHHVRDTLEAEITRTHAVVTIQPDMPEIYGDKTLLISLVQNLVINAIKYRRPGVPPVINISYDHTAEGHVFAIQDNGIGIEEQYRERIFHAFKRLHGKQGEYDGTGLGLAICKKAVEIHGGSIWLTSVPGEGSTFYFSIRDGK